MYGVNFINSIDRVPQIAPEERPRLKEVSRCFAFRTNGYYLSLINWDDPEDPLRRIVIPDPAELDHRGALDASGEHRFRVAPGLEHKYPDTAVLLTTDVCGGVCRFCFRKRLFMHGNREATLDYAPALDYIRGHPGINNVLLSGGDPLMLSTGRLVRLLGALREIGHVRIIRIGSKMPAFHPFRLSRDPELLGAFSRFSRPLRRIYLMTHFNHPRELNEHAVRALAMVIGAGVIVCNQTPLVRGVNDDPATLVELFERLSFAGATPYYLFQVRPTVGNWAYTVPVERGFEIFERARSACAGLANRLRYMMSHVTGKVEVAGLTEEEVYLRYHRAADPADRGRFLVLRRNPEARWLDDYAEPLEEWTPAGEPMEKMCPN
jgi:lysine 2,3-aminomutase